ncbi:MAG TPA: hypothetical protein VK845_03485 [Gemmatimonadales bacterium]|nr:hypothetical protein [Gemmatimonadales bacterium]
MSMRPSSACLLQSTVRLHDIVFPAAGYLLRRTRLAFVDLNNLIAFATRSRDGKVDAYFAGYLPEEVVLLFFREGKLVNAATLGPTVRGIIPIDESLRRLKAEAERGEGVYATAEASQLAMMYGASLDSATLRFVNPPDPAALFPSLMEERFSGTLEFISNGRVNYLQFDDGGFGGGFLCDRAADVSVPSYLESLFAPLTGGGAPAIAGTTLHPPPAVPIQALPSQIRMYRQVVERLVHAVGEEVQDDASTRAQRAFDDVVALHPEATYLRLQASDDAGSLAIEADALTRALAAWSNELLNGVEIVSPGAAPGLLSKATRDHRHVLRAAGFFDTIPWTLDL